MSRAKLTKSMLDLNSFCPMKENEFSRAVITLKFFKKVFLFENSFFFKLGKIHDQESIGFSITQATKIRAFEHPHIP